VHESFGSSLLLLPRLRARIASGYSSCRRSYRQDSVYAATQSLLAVLNAQTMLRAAACLKTEAC
jgi:hypothetical protein